MTRDEYTALRRIYLMRILLSVIFIIASVALAIADTLPDPNKTPGLTVPSLTAKVLCAKGFTTKNIRNVSEALKKQVYELYGLKGNHTGYCSGKEGCEVDHLISLEIGGANDLRNLWPQPYEGKWNAHDKDKVENKLHKLVCEGTITLKEAQTAISSDWIKVYQRYIGETP